MAGERYLTRDHDRIRTWTEERNGKPAAVKETGSGDDPGIIRLDFPGYSGEGSLEEITWDEWFQKFDESDLVLLHQETTADGEKSNFNKLIKAETADDAQKNAKWVGGEGESSSSSARGGSTRRRSRERSEA